MNAAALEEKCRSVFAGEFEALYTENNEVTLLIEDFRHYAICQRLRDLPELRFEMLMDLCAVDYLYYGSSEWETNSATTKGFERAVMPISQINPNSTWKRSRFVVVLHLLSIEHNHRIRLKTLVPDHHLMIDSVVPLWNSANWYEREAFDLYGVLFSGHPDLRRILTDYGFIGHPFRKDFPLVGNVEVRYDAKQERVIYEPVDIVPRTLVPKVIRKGEQQVLNEESGDNHG